MTARPEVSGRAVGLLPDMYLVWACVHSGQTRGHCGRGLGHNALQKPEVLSVSCAPAITTMLPVGVPGLNQVQAFMLEPPATTQPNRTTPGDPSAGRLNSG
jgi:hypothetical protein